MTTPVTSGLGPATARALDATAGGRAAADAIGRLRAGVPRSLTWAPSLVSLVPPAATLTAPTPDLDLLEAVVDRVAAAAADDGPGVRGGSTRTRPTPASRNDLGRRAATGPDTPAAVRPTAHAWSAATAASVPRRGPLDAVDDVGVVADDGGHPFERARLDARRWTRALDGRPLAHGAASALVAAMSAAPGARGVDGATAPARPRRGRHRRAPGRPWDRPASVGERGRVTVRARTARAGPRGPARRRRRAAAGGAPTSWPAATGSTAPGGPPPSARAAAGSAAGGLRDLVQRWADPVPTPTPSSVPGGPIRRSAARPRRR